MKKTIFLILLVVACFNLSAQTNSKFTGALLWKISGKDLSEPSYIFGSHHIIDKEFLDSINGFDKAFNETKQVVGELLMADQAATMQKIQSRAMLPVGYSYKDVLTAEEYEKTSMELKSLFGGDLDQLSIMHPAMITTMYTVVMFMKTFPDMGSIISVDEILQKRGTEEGKPVIGLETAEDQITVLFDSEPIDVQIKDLACVVINSDYAKTGLLDLTNNYLRGDLNDMYNYAFFDKTNPCPSSEKTNNAINKERNDKWLETLPEIMQTPSFIVVGALHLAGEEGLLYKLDKMGYTVEAVY